MSRFFARLLPLFMAAVLSACSGGTDKASEGNGKAPVVLAASSLQESLEEAADAWARQGHAKPVLSFAASSALARQVQEGVPADIFLSADEDWMDTLDKDGLLKPGTRETLLGNTLVLIAPAANAAKFDLADRSAFFTALGKGPLAMADPDSVPAGKYGKAALTSLRLWEFADDRVAIAENVRAAMALVERGEAPLGVVYGSDALASDKVRVVATFPDNSHSPIQYPVAVLKSSTNPDAAAFADYLQSAPALAIFKKHGFTESE